MEELVRNGVVLGGLLAVGLLAARWRRGVWVAWAALVLAVPAAVWLGVLGRTWLPAAPLEPLLGVVGWIAFTQLAARAGGPRIAGPAWLVAWVVGALVGDWGAALLLAPLAPDKATGARWVLAALAGALLLPCGTSALLLLGTTAELRWFGVLLLAIAWPRGRVANEGTARVTALVLIIAAVSWWRPDFAPPVLWGAAAFLAITERPGFGALPGRRLVVLVALAGLVGLARLSGALSEARSGLEVALDSFGAGAAAGVTAIAAVFSALGTEEAASLVATWTLDSTGQLTEPGLAPALALGLAIGGIGPLVAAGLFREGWRRWALGVVVACAYSAWMF